jgi:hypothetical protein
MSSVFSPLLDLRRRRARLEAAEAPVLCQVHGWAPQTPAGKAPPPKESCPGCQQEALRSRDDPERPLVKIPHPLQISKTPMTPQVEALLAGYDERRRAAGFVAPGSAEEARALDWMDAAREERDESPHRGAQLAGARIVGGEWREWYSVPVRGTNRRKIIEVGPS